VDGVSAENGAVLHFPESGHTTVLAPPVPPTFLEALTGRGIRYGTSEALVNAGAADAPLPTTDEADGELRLFNVAARLTHTCGTG
jgi:hypothetical protein